MDLRQDQYNLLIDRIGILLSEGRKKVAQQINTILVQTYREVGRHIFEFEQGGNIKTEYGSQLFESLSIDLSNAHRKGFSRSNLTCMRKLYINSPKRETLSHVLTWSHYFEILKSDSENIINDLFVSKYQLYLPNKEELQTELKNY